MFRKFLILAITTTSFCALNPQSANASLKDQFKKNSACTWESSTYEFNGRTKGSTWNDPEDYTIRYCITSDNKVIKFSTLLEPYTKRTKPQPQKGPIGKPETWYGKNTYKYYISQHEIEGNDLVYYECTTDNTRDCADELQRVVRGTKIGINQINNKKNKENYQTLLFKGVGKYVGEVKEGQMNGNGTFTWEDGNEYTGGFKNGSFEGKGTMSYKSGNKITVNFKDGRKEGLGKYTYKNGAVLEVPYINDQPEGIGKYTDENGVSKEGTWSKGKFVKWN